VGGKLATIQEGRDARSRPASAPRGNWLVWKLEISPSCWKLSKGRVVRGTSALGVSYAGLTIRYWMTLLNTLSQQEHGARSELFVDTVDLFP
jgi:hypothetical protein